MSNNPITIFKLFILRKILLGGVPEMHNTSKGVPARSQNLRTAGLKYINWIIHVFESWKVK